VSKKLHKTTNCLLGSASEEALKKQFISINFQLCRTHIPGIFSTLDPPKNIILARQNRRKLQIIPRQS
jgi:hypothetical protein